MALEYRETPEKIIVRLNQLDERVISAPGLESDDVISIAASSNKRLVIDFSGATFVSSAMIGKLFLLYKDGQRRSVDVRFTGVSSDAQKMFDLMNLKFPWDDDDDGLGAGVPNRKPPNSPEGHAEPPRE